MQKRHTDRERYFIESSQTSAEYYIPYINGFHPITAGCRVLEVGCGEGGNLLPFAGAGCAVTGVDLCEGRIRQARAFFAHRGVTGCFTCCDFLAYPVPETDAGRFDVILLHDVIEHVGDKQTFLARVMRFLKPDGILFVAFPAWQMPFGGHQQICRHPFWSRVPFFHLLPLRVYRFVLWRMARENDRTIAELMDIRRCRTPTELFESVAARVPARIMNRQLWLVNPHYRQKFGLRPRRLNAFVSRLPRFRDYFSTSCFYLLQLPRQGEIRAAGQKKGSVEARKDETPRL